MGVIGNLSAESVTDDDDLAPTARELPGGVWPGGAAGYIYDGAAYCLSCAPDVSVESAGDGEMYPLTEFPPGGHDPDGFGVGVVAANDEWDYPGASCHVCGDRLNTTLLVHDYPHGHPHPVVEVRDPNDMGRHAAAYLLDDDDTEVRIMLAEDFAPYGEAGATSWIPRDDVVAGLDD
jgi:hypothetical protein